MERSDTAPPAANERLCERLADARKRRGYSVRQLARLIGVTDVTIGNWEHGRTTPRANRFPVLAGTLGVSMRWLISGDGDPAQLRAPAPLAGETEGILAELRDLRKASDHTIERLAGLERRLASALRDSRP